MRTFNHEFLIKLAPIWLACRWRVMGNPLMGRMWPKTDLANDLLGMIDYGYEMHIIAKRAQNKHKAENVNLPESTQSNDPKAT